MRLSARVMICIPFLLGLSRSEPDTSVLLNRPVIDEALNFDAESVWTVALFELEGRSDFVFVDRKNLHNMLEEMSLAPQSLTNPETSAKIGNITGAQYFVNARCVRNQDAILLTLQTVNVSTSQTHSGYANIKTDSILELGKEIAALTTQVLTKAREKHDEPVLDTKPEFVLPEGISPIVAVWIPETHINQRLADPAAEIEITRRLIAAGFTVKDLAMHESMERDGAPPLETAARLGRTQHLDYVIYGEGLTERGDRIGAFEGVRARVEIKVVDVETGKIVYSDSSHAGSVDLAESTAAKTALKKAASQLADTALPVLAPQD